MWSTILLCFLASSIVSVTSSDVTSDYAWKSNTEYQYLVQGRTLTSLHQVDNQYAGVLIRALLTVQLRRPSVLVARLSETKYAQVHSKLPDGWRSEIPQDQLNFRSMSLSNKPFEIQMKNGTVQELTVDKSITNWEANIIKSVVSQLQVDVQGENMVKSQYNQEYEQSKESISAKYKTMEESVTGKCETFYDIEELPEYILQSKPELVPFPQMKDDGKIINVMKSRNYDNCDELIVYHYGLGELRDWEPVESQMGDFFSKFSSSRIILSGTLKKHTIQSSVTTNKIILKPTPNTSQKGLVVSQMNITLQHVGPAFGQTQELKQRQPLGNLVYRYNSPHSNNNLVRRHPRSLDNNQHQSNHYGDSNFSEESSEQYLQNKPTLEQPPEIPLLPYTVGYKGQSIKYSPNFNMVHAVHKLTKQIAEELQKPSDIPKENTLSKFTILSNLLRNMNYEELQEVSQEMFNLKNKHERKEIDSWKTFRDVVAQTGTGPALLIVRDWIYNNKICGSEAAAIVATVAYSARTPSDEYIRTYYALATDSKVQKEAYLNDTIIMSFADLIRKVYVNEDLSHREYSVHVFGKFYKQNAQAVHQEYIPFLAKQLKQAIHNADSHKIQIYIRALGNTGHKHILKVFEPYLEGDKQVSQFQRLLMVMCMDQLAKVEPLTARSVLYKIYQNEGEASEIRVAAVHQLMKTLPPASMLQRMAQFTNEDSNNDVNSAVKSAIESAATLKEPQYKKQVSNARSAVSLLNPKMYGIQYSKQYFKDHVESEKNIIYKQYAGYIASDNSIIPQGIMYNSHANLGGVKRQYLNLYAMVSNVEDLFKVLKKQTKQTEAKKKPGAKQQSQWSAENIARLLNIQYPETEQLEGNLQFGIDEVKRFYTFDNQTIKHLPEYLKELVHDFKTGKEFNFTKLYNPYEMTLSFPTAMGLPFIYTLETPTLLSLNGEIRMTSQPEPVSNNGDIQTPQAVNVTTDIKAVISTKTQAKLGFVTPFDHQHYIAGYDKNIQLNLPVRTHIDIDLKNQQIKANFKPIDKQNEEIFHYSTVPYTAKQDILDFQPVCCISSYKIIHTRKPKEFEYIFGKKQGIAFRVQYETGSKFADFKSQYDQFQKYKGQVLPYFMSPLIEDSLTYSNFSVKYNNAMSYADSISFQFGWNQTYFSGESKSKTPEFEELYNKASNLDESRDRQQYFLKNVVSGINSADGYVYDMSVQFEGKKPSYYNATLAFVSSVVDKSRVLFYVNKNAFNKQHFEVCFQAENEAPNTNDIDFNYALKFDPTTKSYIKFAYGKKCQRGTKIELKVKSEKTQERQYYIQNHPLTKICYEQMKEKDKQLYACRNKTASANFLDQITVNIKHDNLSPEVRNITYHIYSVARYFGYPYLDENILEGHGQQNQIQININYNPNFRSVNISLGTENMQTDWNQINVNSWGIAVFAVHPVFKSHRRINAVAQNELLEPTCIVDQNFVNTFDNKTYGVNLGKTWHLQMHYRVQRAGRKQWQKRQSQERFQNENDYDYALLVRDSDNNKREVKLTLNDESNYYEIDLVPAGGSHPVGKVSVNNKKIEFDDKHSYDIDDGLVQIYALPNGEIKVEVNGEFYFVYDGKRIKLTTKWSDQLRGEIRGLCGNFDGEQTTDFTTPRNCIVRNHQDFVATYAVIDSSAQSSTKERQTRAYQAPCYEVKQIYANVISPRDYQNNNQEERDSKQSQRGSRNSGLSSSCTKHQTQYVEEDDGETLCFTLRPLPVCKSGCRSNKMIMKNVDVHCVNRSNVSEMWQKQIEKGVSLDFTLKQATKNVKMKVPQSCSS